MPERLRIRSKMLIYIHQFLIVSSMLKNINILQYLLILFLAVSCSPSTNKNIDNQAKNETDSTSIKNEINIILFEKEKYTKTKPAQIQIYKRRLDVPDKFKEIGIIKSIKKIEDNSLINIASENGADALIRDGFNYIMIKFTGKKGGEILEQKTI